ncbi:hypothetical protein [Sphingobium nicotianae]|uniref:Circumsporozoite protein n=1 Tax=Sphingobium nicotianae TaxID=2782607 RepID=A0A9X1DFA8_9SPHN|nr:hypothetical protein [Sphingobium nicotianae]MBT2188930.1 hypothetical protein [Sphingobium nicotianae]
MPRATLALIAALAASLALGACEDKKAAGNAVAIHDMEVVDGTVNDSMTDLDAVKADGVGNVDNAGNVSHPVAPKQSNAAEDAETVATE